MRLANIQADNQPKKQKVSIFKVVDLWRNIISIVFYIAFVSYNIIAKKGNATINKVLLYVTIAYLIFFATLVLYDASDKSSPIRKTGTRVYKNIKRIMLIISALMTIFTIITVKDEKNWLQVISACFTVINLVTQIIIGAVISKIGKAFSKMKDNVVDMVDNILAKGKGEKDEEVYEYMKNSENEVPFKKAKWRK